jgi:hypothetical protein
MITSEGAFVFKRLLPSCSPNSSQPAAYLFRINDIEPPKRADSSILGLRFSPSPEYRPHPVGKFLYFSQ